MPKATSARPTLARGLEPGHLYQSGGRSDSDVHRRSRANEEEAAASSGRETGAPLSQQRFYFSEGFHVTAGEVFAFHVPMCD